MRSRKKIAQIFIHFYPVRIFVGFLVTSLKKWLRGVIFPPLFLGVRGFLGCELVPLPEKTGKVTRLQGPKGWHFFTCLQRRLRRYEHKKKNTLVLAQLFKKKCQIKWFSPTPPPPKITCSKRICLGKKQKEVWESCFRQNFHDVMPHPWLKKQLFKSARTGRCKRACLSGGTSNR